jgi:2-amino-4-hydroxy-6-hydroxymethyldihydropteridine diphosphokinase
MTVILIGIGSNLPYPPTDSPRATAEAALAAMPTFGVQVLARSGWYLSAPMPASDQPWFVNAVVSVASGLAPEELLEGLLRLETEFGRTRGLPNAARTLDLDLLDYDAQPIDTRTLVLPHPRLHRRLFVLEPLREVAPDWRHPRLGLTAAELIDQLPPGQRLSRLDG